MIRVAPSLLASDYLHFANALQKVISSGADVLHYDVMDGEFVPAITFGQDLLSRISEKGFPVDVHLMIANPEKHVQDFAQAGAHYITVHQEAAGFALNDILRDIRQQGCLAGVSVKPYTSVESLADCLELADLVLIMTVEPGKGGQKLLPFTLEKVRRIRQMCNERGLHPIIEVDGGINIQTAPLAVEAGAEMLVTGSAFFKADDPTLFVEQLKNLA